MLVTNFLSEERLGQLCPSVFADCKSSETSARYSFIPTIDIVRGLNKAGFMPVSAVQNKSRIDGKENFVKHLLKFRHESMPITGGNVPEIVLVNSHDGKSSYQLRAGIYRLVCTNGLIIGNELFCHKIRHKGDIVNQVVDAANNIIEVTPLSVRKVKDWSEIKLDERQRLAYAEAVMPLKFDQDNEQVKPWQLLTPRRTIDKEPDLWTTFNVVQENLIRGGVRYITDAGSRMRTRAVNSITENVRLNTALWTLTEKMAELVA